jgi:DNA-dependent protein kinase catalytic subunit
MASNRRPKCLTVHGSNEKDYMLLIKGGEDLRLDQRVQQLFQIMNKVFKEDPLCLNRDLNLKTFNVVPITNRLGSLEWIDNTQPLKNIVDREHIRVENGETLNQSRSLRAIQTWLKGLKGNENPNTHIATQHLAALG